MLNVIHIENGWEKHFSSGKLWPSLFLGGEWNRAKTCTDGRQMIPYNSHFSPSIAALLLCLVSGIGWNSFNSWLWLIYAWCDLSVTCVLLQYYVHHYWWWRWLQLVGGFWLMCLYLIKYFLCYCCVLCGTAAFWCYSASLLMMEVIAACGWILADACNQFWSGQGSQKSPLKPFDLSTQK